MATLPGTTTSFADIVAAADPERESRPEPGYEFSGGRKFEASKNYPKDDNVTGE